MGTNYYAVKTLTDEGGSLSMDLKIHIGKDSAGWKFVFDCSHGLFTEGHSAMTMLLNEDYTIQNEYGRIIAGFELYEKIQAQHNDRSLKDLRDDPEGIIDSHGFNLCFTSFT